MRAMIKETITCDRCGCRDVRVHAHWKGVGIRPCLSSRA